MASIGTFVGITWVFNRPKQEQRFLPDEQKESLF
jgi:hypothetical protein